MKKLANLLFWTLLMSLAGCSDDDSVDGGTLSLSITSLKDIDGGYNERIIDITADGAWQVAQSADEDWFYVYPLSGSGNGKLTVYIENSDVPHEGEFTVRLDGSSAMQTVQISQLPGDDNGTAQSSDIQRRAIGFGYDIFDKYADASCLKGSVLDYGKLTDGNTPYIEETNIRESKYSSKTGKSSSELLEKFTLNAELKAEIKLFTGEAKANYETSHMTNEDYEFGMYSCYTIKQKYELNAAYIGEKGKDLRNYLTSRAKRAINGETEPYKGDKGIPFLLKQYGTHIVLSSYLGGRYDYSMELNRSQVKDSRSIEAFLKIGAKKAKLFEVSASVDAKDEEAYNNAMESITTKVTVKGGNAAYIQEVSEGNVKNWQQGIYNGDGCVLMEFDNNSLLPIWHLCEDQGRAQKIKAYIENEWATARKLPDVDYQRVAVDIPTYWDPKGTLVKEVIFNGKRIAEICNEYYYDKDATKRLTIVYPYINGLMDMEHGFFVGNETFPCEYVNIKSEYGHNSKTMWSKYGNGNTPATTKVWIKGNVILPYSAVSAGKNTNVGEVRDEYCIDTRIGEGTVYYPLVKFCDVIITRKNCKAKVYSNGTAIADSSYVKDNGTIYYHWKVPGAVFELYREPYNKYTPGHRSAYSIAPDGWCIAGYKAILQIWNQNGIDLLNNVTGLIIDNEQMGFSYIKSKSYPYLGVGEHMVGNRCFSPFFIVGIQEINGTGSRGYIFSSSSGIFPISRSDPSDNPFVPVRFVRRLWNY